MTDISTFTDSPPLTLGVELELQLLSRRDFDLTRGATDLLAGLEQDSRHGDIKLEITESMIEISTQPQATPDGIAADLNALHTRLADACAHNNVALCGGGTHPFHHWPERRICPGERFDQIYQRYGYLAKQFTVFGQHIHVGCASADDAIWLTQALGLYVPHFIALSASSPFVDGVDSFFQSARLNAVSAFPLSGQCPPLADWQAFIAHFRFLQHCGIASSIKDLYWDVRPKPEFGTVEIRVCDTPLSLERAVTLAAFAQALAAWLLATRPQHDFVREAHVARFNKFQACRFGLQAEIASPASQSSIRLDKHLQELLDKLLPFATQLGTTHWLDRILQLSAPSDADWLRQQRASHGNLHDTMRAACTRLAFCAHQEEA